MEVFILCYLNIYTCADTVQSKAPTFGLEKLIFKFLLGKASYTLAAIMKIKRLRSLAKRGLDPPDHLGPQGAPKTQRTCSLHPLFVDERLAKAGTVS